MLAMDDYIRFGGMYDALERAGAVLITYVPKKREIIVAVPRKKEKEFEKVVGKKGKSNRGLVFFKLDWK